MSQGLTRQQIYDRIKASSKDSYVLEEMKRLGFWDNSAVPTITETLIVKEAELNKELQGLLEKDRKYSNQEAMLREMRKNRMKQAKEKREATKQKNEQIRKDKADKWSKTILKEVIYLGENVSAGLNNTQSNKALLQQFKLPFFDNVTSLAKAIGIDLASLKYLTFHRKVSQHSHYHSFEVDKKSGGKRKISAPKPKLKQLQLWILENILDKIILQEHVHGFVKQKSIVTNAMPHVGKDLLINIDLKDFFPTISYKRVKGLFAKLGYSEQIATILALACTQANTDEVSMDGVKYFVQNGERFLPQGSPASPAISNIIVYKLDKRIYGLAQKLGFAYSRYADDLSFSSNKENEKNVAQLLYFVNKIIESEDFIIHPDKTHIMRAKSQQKVTGIVVNQKLNVEKQKLKKFRALLHNIEINGWQNQQWGKAVHLINAIEGYINFVNMVNPVKAQQFKNQLRVINQKHGSPVVNIISDTKAKVDESKNIYLEKGVDSDQIIEEKPPTNINNSQSDWWNLF